MSGRRWLAALAAALMVVVAAVVLVPRDSRPPHDSAGARTGGGSAPGAPGTTTPAVRIGIVANTQDTNVGAEQDAARELGVTLLREELRWGDVEPTDGRWDDRTYDALTGAAARRGLQLLPLLFRTPKWLAPESLQLPPSLPRWQRFVGHVVARYGPGGGFWQAHPELDGDLAMTTWEVWNEPYLESFSKGGTDPVAYARLVRATVEAGHAVDPRARFLAAVEAGYDPGDGTSRNWADDLFAADPALGPLLGGVVVHPYAPGSPLAPASKRELRFARTEELLATARRNGVTAQRPLWITELGWSTCSKRPPCTSREEQATYWRQALERLAQPPLRGAVAAVLGYRLRDIGGDGPEDTLADFGLLTAAGEPKPAWAVVRRAARRAAAAAP